MSLAKAPGLGPPQFPQNAIAWRAGGATADYPAPPKPASTDKRKEDRRARDKSRARADAVLLDTVADELNKSWGPRTLNGWCENFALRLCAPCALASEAHAAASHGPAAHVRQLLQARPPPPIVTMMACKSVRCKTYFCRYLIEGGKASSEAHLKRRIQEATAPSPPALPRRETRAPAHQERASASTQTPRPRAAKKPGRPPPPSREPRRLAGRPSTLPAFRPVASCAACTSHPEAARPCNSEDRDTAPPTTVAQRFRTLTRA